MLAAALIAAASIAAPGAAQPAHCERSPVAHAWPVTGAPIGAADATPITADEARDAVAAFRREWRSVPHPTAVLRSFTECLDASLEHFVVRRVSRDEARSRVDRLFESFPRNALAGTLHWSEPWVWEVYWGGASRRHPPAGPLSMYLSRDLATVVAAVQWPEG